jgi:hypothetical protein
MGRLGLDVLEGFLEKVVVNDENASLPRTEEARSWMEEKESLHVVFDLSGEGLRGSLAGEKSIRRLSS